MTARQLHLAAPLWPTDGNGTSGPPEWTHDAPCRRNPDLWFSEQPADVEAAKNACLAECPLKRVIACMDYAFDNEVVWGVWGGVSRDERVEKTCRECGETKPLSDFGQDYDSPDGRNTACKSCYRRLDREAASKRRAAKVAAGEIPAADEQLEAAIARLDDARDLRTARTDEKARRFKLLVDEQGLAAARKSAGVSRRTAQRWLNRLGRLQDQEVAA